MPGYTHLQRAQPVTVGHHLLAWVEMLERDLTRFAAAAAAAEPSPLGAGALAGSTLPLPRAREPAPQLARRGRRPRLRARLPLRGSRLLRPSLPDRRGARALDDVGVRLRPARRGRRHRVVDDAAEAEPRCGRARTRQGRHRDRAPDRSARDRQGPAARLQPRPAGGQGAGLRGAGRSRRRARSADGARARARARSRAAGRRGERSAPPRHRRRRGARPGGNAVPRRARAGRGVGAGRQLRAAAGSRRGPHPGRVASWLRSLRPARASTPCDAAVSGGVHTA